MTLAPGATQSIPVTVTITAAGASVTAQVTNPSVADSNPANNNSIQTTGVLLADVTVILDLPSSANASTTVTATVTFTNLNFGIQSATATNVIGTVTLSNGQQITYTLGNLSPGASVTNQITVNVPANGSVLGTASVATLTPETNSLNNISTDSLVVSTFADVSVTISVPSTGTPGQTITGVVSVFNNGPSTAQNVSVTVMLPNGSTATVFTTSSLPSGSSATATVIYAIPAAQTATMSWTAKVTTTTADTNVPNNTSVGTTTVVVVRNASISGRVWLDTDSNKVYTAGKDLDLSGWKVELLQNGNVVGTATTAADGSYVIGGQIPGGSYSVRFKNPNGQIVVSTPFNQGPAAVNGRTTQNGNPSLGTTTSVIGGNTTVGGAIDNIVLYAGDNTINQNLPIDPSGIVYDAVTRQPVAGAVVTLIGPNGNPVPGTDLVQGNSTQTTDGSGIYQFDLLPTAPSGRYKLQITPPQGYANTPATQGGVSQPGVAPGTVIGSVANGVYTPPSGGAFISIQPNATVTAVGVNGAGPVGAPGTQYFLDFNLTVGGLNQSSGVIHNHIPLDPLVSGALLVNKVGDKTTAEVGDSVKYIIRIRNTTAGPIAATKLEDLLPAGFRYILGTAQLNGAVIANPAGGVGRALTFDIGVVPGNTTVELSYFVRLGAGSQQGDGINRATAVFPGAGNVPVRSNTAQYKVNVQGGVFSNDGCIIGKVYVDCDGTHTQTNESGSRELGIPGVRLVMLDGTFIVTDNEGKYSICGVKPQTHVIKVDRSTLPKGSRLLPSSNRNAGVGDSIFVDIKGGELARADFIEGSCSPEVLDQVKARRAQGGVLAPEKEMSQSLKIDNRPLEVQQQILPNVRSATPEGAKQ